MGRQMKFKLFARTVLFVVALGSGREAFAQSQLEY